MAIDSSRGPLPSETAPPRKARATASPLGSLVRLLARQAAREVIASGLGVYRVAPHKAALEIDPAAVGLSTEK
jgi:hypothetical protein